MSKFKFPKRIDEQVAGEGVWFPIEDEFGNSYGRWKLRSIDPHSQSYKLAVNRARQKYATQIRRNQMDDEKLTRIGFVETSISDWDLPLDPEEVAQAIKNAKSEAKKAGKPFEADDEKAVVDALKVPFSVDEAHEIFATEESEWLILQLIKKASDVTNYGPESAFRDHVDGVTKN